MPVGKQNRGRMKEVSNPTSVIHVTPRRMFGETDQHTVVSGQPLKRLYTAPGGAGDSNDHGDPHHDYDERHRQEQEARQAHEQAQRNTDRAAVLRLAADVRVAEWQKAAEQHHVELEQLREAQHQAEKHNKHDIAYLQAKLAAQEAENAALRSTAVSREKQWQAYCDKQQRRLAGVEDYGGSHRTWRDNVAPNDAQSTSLGGGNSGLPSTGGKGDALPSSRALAPGNYRNGGSGGGNSGGDGGRDDPRWCEHSWSLDAGDESHSFFRHKRAHSPDGFTLSFSEGSVHFLVLATLPLKDHGSVI